MAAGGTGQPRRKQAVSDVDDLIHWDLSGLLSHSVIVRMVIYAIPVIALFAAN